MSERLRERQMKTLALGLVFVVTVVGTEAACPYSTTCPQHNAFAKRLRDEPGNGGTWRVYLCTRYGKEHEFRVKCN
jgi:hypothetical protein